MACQLVIKRTKTMSNVTEFDLSSSAPTELEMQQRSKYVERILLNHCCEQINILSVFSCFLGMLLGIVFTLFKTLFPQHHPIGNPTYWYEPMLSHLIGWIPIAAVFLISVCYFCIETKERDTAKICWIANGVGSTPTITVTALSYIAWIHIGELMYPMPSTGYIIAVVSWILCWLWWWNVTGLMMTLVLFLFFSRLSPLLTILLYLLPPSFPRFLFCILYCPVGLAIVSSSLCHVHDLGICRSRLLNGFLFFERFRFFIGLIWLQWYLLDLIWRARRNISFSKFVDLEAFEEASGEGGENKYAKKQIWIFQITIGIH